MGLEYSVEQIAKECEEMLTMAINGWLFNTPLDNKTVMLLYKHSNNLSTRNVRYNGLKNKIENLIKEGNLNVSLLEIAMNREVISYLRLFTENPGELIVDHPLYYDKDKLKEIIKKSKKRNL